MEFGYLFISALLIFVIIAGVAGLFFCATYVRKICCLSISYSSFLLFMILVSFRNGDRLNTILTIMVSILIVFASNLFIGILMARNIEKQD